MVFSLQPTAVTFTFNFFLIEMSLCVHMIVGYKAQIKGQQLAKGDLNNPFLSACSDCHIITLLFQQSTKTNSNQPAQLKETH